VRDGPDLVVVDRSLPERLMAVRSFAGNPTPRSPSSTTTISQGLGFPPSRWKLLVGAAQSPGPDLVMVGSASALGRAPLEVHVLLASSGYRALGAQTRLGLPVSDGRRLRFLVGRPNRSGLLLFAVKPRAHAIAELLYR
jgi:hypothetical protein